MAISTTPTSSVYRCRDDKRRLAILATTLNGIDALEVLDTRAPVGSPRQRTLLVRLFRAAPALPTGVVWGDCVRIDGGARVSGVEVQWAAQASAVPVGLLTAAEAAFVSALPDLTQLLVVRTATAGDFSTYRLAIVDPVDRLRPLATFDPVLNGIDFSFKVECPTDFDCEAPQETPPTPAVEPRIDYLAKDFGSFRRLMLDRMAALAPAWQERHPADLGVAVVEALAYVGDHLSYAQDAIATEAYLGTARRRVSVRRHARMLDYTVHEGCNARTWVTFEVNANGVIVERVGTGSKGQRLLTRCTERAVVEPDRLDALLGQARPLVFEPRHDAALYVAHNKISLYTWGDSRCCLPEGATRATLVDGGPGGRLRLAPGDVLILEELKGPLTGLEADASPIRRHAVRLTEVSPASPTTGTARPEPLTAQADPLTGTGVVEIAWGPMDALPFSLCLSAEVEGEQVQDVTVARGNVVLVDQGQTLAPEPLPALPAAGRYQPALARTGVTHAAPYSHLKAVGQGTAAGPRPASEALLQDLRQTVPQVSLEEGASGWSAKSDLLGSDRFARDFVVEVEEDGRAWLRFGDGTLGRPAVGGLVATYRVDSRRAGNVGAETIAHVVTTDPAITRVRNPLPAVGGTDPEPIEDVKVFAPQAFRTQARAVTEADYARMAEEHREVQKAVATRRWTGSWSTLFLTVDRLGGLPVDAAFEDELRDHLERYRLAGHDLEIEPPVFVPLDLRLVVCLSPGYRRADVHRALLDAFGSGLRRDGQPGFFHPDHFTFGQPVYLSQVIDAAMGVAGVHWVDPSDAQTRFQRYARAPAGELSKGVLTMAPLEIARLDNSLSLPENGKLAFVFKGGA